MKINVLVVFGGTGHLARNRIIPYAIENNKIDLIIALGRSVNDTHEYLNLIKLDSKKIQFVNFDINTGDPCILIDKLSNLSIKKIVFYVSVYTGHVSLMQNTANIINSIKKNITFTYGLIAVEKPIGHSYSSSIEIIDIFNKLKDIKVFYMDHFLYKKKVCDLKNRFFGVHIDNIEFVAKENTTISGREALWETSGGIIGDMIQNHAMNSIAYICGLKISKMKLEHASCYAIYKNSEKPVYADITLCVLLNKKSKFKTKITLNVGKYQENKITTIDINEEHFDLNTNNDRAYFYLLDSLFSNIKKIKSIKPNEIIASWKIFDNIKCNTCNKLVV